ncbi:MAG: gamma-butyrobetaine dioxygenase [Acidimicrobiaceae bacterium]|nr:gamma-butyrobetaine dioxygenase [Acidimicrobiaceae bacterium]
MTLSLDGTLAAFPAIWLRDNCPCESCRDSASDQKFFQPAEIPHEIAVVEVQAASDEIVVTFTPDGHRSTFSQKWLEAQRSAATMTPRELWRGVDLDETAGRAEWSRYLSDDAERLRVLRGVQRLGFAVLKGTPTTERTVLGIARTFGYVRETNYGELFDVRVEAEPTNLAFSALAISPHTDNPYRDPAPTMQLLHCLVNSVSGGESGLVDGILAANILRDEHPEHFIVLSHTPVTFAWSDPNNVLRATRPVLELDERGHLRSIRLNSRSMQPLRLDYDDIVAYYDAYRAFFGIVTDPSLARTFRLDPGDCLIFDNTRLLHSRTAFEVSGGGHRHLQGCYADLDGLASTVEVLARREQNPLL